MGLGTHGGGVAAARWLAEQGAVVTITDLASAEVLENSLAALDGVPIARWTLGQHAAHDFESAELVVVNPAVPPDSPWLASLAHCHRLAAPALSPGPGRARLTSEIELFLDHCPALVVGVTGTVGKSTTASMLAAAMQTAGRRAWLGGNIGRSLLPCLGEIQPGDVVVLELSSFQLHYLSDDCRWPEIALLTNCSPNHLAWHGDYRRYAAAKHRLLSHARQVAIHPSADEGTGWPLPLGVTRLPVLAAEELTLPEHLAGEHQRQNAALAATVARALGISHGSIQAALSTFAGLPHRQALVTTIDGRRFINDSKATTPAAVAAAIAASPAPTWLLLGGIDKGGDWETVCEHLGGRIRGVAVYGADAARIAGQLAPANVPLKVYEDLFSALRECWRQSQSGDSIVLSPGCASFDQFADYAARGEAFAAAVFSLAATAARSA